MSQHDSTPDSLVVMDVGEGQVVQEAGSWSVRRSLSGGGLPGQARAVSGSSVGSGSVQVASPAGRSPWSPGPVRPGGRVRVEARADVDRPWSSVAQMTARSVSGTARSQALDVDVEDDLGGLLGPATIDQAVTLGRNAVGWAYIDAAHAIERVATRAGYRSTTPASPGLTTLLSVPLTGSLTPEVGASRTGYPEGTRRTWVTQDGRIAATGSVGQWDLAGSPQRYLTITARSCGPNGVLVSMPDVYSTPDSRGITLARTAWTWGGTGVTTSWTALPGAPTDAGVWRVHEVQVDLGSPVSTSTWQARCRIDGGAWSAWASVAAPTYAGPLEDGSAAAVSLVSGAQPAVYDLRVLTASTLTDDTVVHRPLTARVGASGSQVPAIYAESGGSGWDMIQRVATATLGAAWINEAGTLVYRGRDAMRAGTPVEAVVAEDSLEDVPWSISVDDVADRVEVVYRPTVVATTSRPTFTVWESTDTLTLAAGQSRTIYADLPVVANVASYDPWLPVWDTTTFASLQPTEFSRWNAFPNADLTGTQPANNAIVVESAHVSASRVRITVRNASAGTLYVSQLTYRATMLFSPSEPVTISQGATAESARAPFTLDCGAWVHDDDTAAEILQWLAGTLSQPLPVLTGVRVVPDMTRRLGSIVTVRDRTTALTAKVLITGIDTSHSPGSLEQRLDLTILSTTFDDVDTWLTREGLTTFDALDARLTALGLTTFDKLDDFLSRLGGTL